MSKVPDWIGHSLTHILVSHILLGILALLGGMGIIEHKKKQQIETLESQRATVTSPKGIYVWQVSSKDVRWTGKINVDSSGAVTNVDMWTIEMCSDGVKELELVESFDKEKAKVSLADAGQISVTIPVKFNTYDKCNKVGEYSNTLTGELSQTLAYQGDITYEIAPNKGRHGGMWWIKELPGSR